jgi:hypothetical protein
MREWWSWMGRGKEKQTRKKGGLCVEGIRKEEEESEGDKSCDGAPVRLWSKDEMRKSCRKIIVMIRISVSRRDGENVSLTFEGCPTPGEN